MNNEYPKEYGKSNQLMTKGTMSSDSDSDSDMRKKGRKVDSDESGSDHKSKRRGKGPTSKSFVDSESGSSMSEDEDVKPSPSRKRKIPTNKGTAKKRGRGRGSSDDEKIPGVDGLELTEDERKMIQGMSEKEREQEIFRRMEDMETRKIREEIARKLEQKTKKEESPDVKERGRGRKKERKRLSSDESDASVSSERNKKATKKKGIKKESDGSEEDVRVMPSEANRKKKQKSAMEDLLVKRREKEAKKASLAVADVFGKENDSSSDSSSTNSSRSSSPSSRSTSRSRSRSASPSKEDQASRRLVETLEELKLARLSRFKLAKFVHAPFFNKTVIDCYVMIGVGPMPGRPNKENYRIAQVVDVVETAKVYNVEETRTNKGLKLRMGTEDRVYRLEFVSNKEFTNAHFEEWLTIMKKYNRPIPTMGEIHRKMKDIANAVNHQFTNDEVNAMIKEKARWKEIPKNFAMAKGELMKKLEYARQNHDHEEAAKLQAEIDKLDTRADELDNKRSGDIKAIDWINKRNRNMMKEQFLGDKKIDGFMGKEDDPFTRKSGKMRVVSGSAKNLTALDDETGGAGVSASSSASNLSSTPVPLNKSLSSSSKTPDLFSFHSISVGHDELDLNTLRTPVIEDTSSRTLHTATPSTGGRPLSLADYKKRKMEAKASQA